MRIGLVLDDRAAPGRIDGVRATTRFAHAAEVRERFPDLVAGVAQVRSVEAAADTGNIVGTFEGRARERLRTGPESGLPEIKAWRQAFGAMGLKPTQYRCASEALLRRIRTHGSLPRLHPLVDVCNAVSAAYAIPVAALDLARIDGDLLVRPAAGDEDYETFAGEHEQPEPGEIVFADNGGHAHARRWTNRQSRRSAIGAATSDALIVVEALHDTAADDVHALLDELAAVLAGVWQLAADPVLLDRATPIATLTG